MRPVFVKMNNILVCVQSEFHSYIKNNRRGKGTL